MLSVEQNLDSITDFIDNVFLPNVDKNSELYLCLNTSNKNFLQKSFNNISLEKFDNYEIFIILFNYFNNSEKNNYYTNILEQELFITDEIKLSNSNIFDQLFNEKYKKYVILNEDIKLKLKCLTLCILLTNSRDDIPDRSAYNYLISNIIFNSSLYNYLYFGENVFNLGKKIIESLDLVDDILDKLNFDLYFKRIDKITEESENIEEISLYFFKKSMIDKIKSEVKYELYLKTKENIYLNIFKNLDEFEEVFTQGLKSEYQDCELQETELYEVNVKELIKDSEFVLVDDKIEISNFDELDDLVKVFSNMLIEKYVNTSQSKVDYIEAFIQYLDNKLSYIDEMFEDNLKIKISSKIIELENDESSNKNIMIDEETLTNRLTAFYSLHGYNIYNFDNVDKLKLLIYGEQCKKILPIGRKWELLNSSKDYPGVMKLQKDEINYKQHYINEAYSHLIKKKEEYERNLIQPQNITIGHNLEGFLVMKNEKDRYKFGDFEKWKSFFSSSMKYEIEIRFQNIFGTEFGKLFSHFMKSKNYYFNNITSVSNIYYTNGSNYSYRSITFNENNKISRPFNQMKTEIDKFFVYDWDLKIVKSEETNINEIPVQGFNIERRHKNTFLFYTPITTDSLYNFELSLSVVITEYPTNVKKFPVKTYEVELERKFGLPKYWNVYKVQTALINILNIIHNYNPLPKTIKVDLMNSFSRFNIDTDPMKIAAQVIPLTTENIMEFLTVNYYYSLKVDGQRKLLIMKSNLGTFLMNFESTDNFNKIDNKLPSIERIGYPFKFHNESEVLMILDTEVEYKDGEIIIHIFDVIFDSLHINIRVLKFNKRYLYLQQVFKDIKNIKNLFYKNLKIDIKIKKFSLFHNLEDIIPTINYVYQTDNYDGVIFQPDVVYNDLSHRIFKWKPRYMNTIDFLISCNKPLFKNKQYEVLIPVDRTQKPYKENNYEIWKNNELFEYKTSFSLNNFVVECFFHPIIKRFVPTKIRFNKKFPNKDSVIESNFNIIRNPISLNYFKGIGMKFLRKAINSFKTTLLKKYGGTLLDIGTGQGGDINKWDLNKKGFDKVICYEPSSQMLDELQSRLKKLNIRYFVDDEQTQNKNQKYKNNDYKVIVIKKYFNNENIFDLIYNNDISVDIITMFFSTNFVFESAVSLNDFIEALFNVTRTSLNKQTIKYIKQGVPILILTLNGSKLLSLVKDKYPNVVNIETLSNGHIYGNLIKTTIYDSFVDNVEDYLFDVNTFIDKASKYFDVENIPVLDNLIKCNLSDAENSWLSCIECLLLHNRDKEIDYNEQEYIFEENENNEYNLFKDENDYQVIEYQESISSIEEYEDENIGNNFIENIMELIDELPNEKEKIKFPELLNITKINYVNNILIDVNELLNFLKCLYSQINLIFTYKPFTDIHLKEKNTVILTILELMTQFEFQNISSDFPKEFFSIESILKYKDYQKSYYLINDNLKKTGSFSCDLLGLLVFGFFETNFIFPQYICVNNDTYYIFRDNITPEFIDILLKTFREISVYVPLTTPCIVFVCKNLSYTDTPTFNEIDLKIKMIEAITNLIKKYENIFDDEEKSKSHMLYTKKLLSMNIDNNKDILSFAKKLGKGITYQTNSCYADAVLMAMGASNMFTVFYSLLKDDNNIDSQELCQFLEKIYRGNELNSEYYIKFVGFELQTLNDSVDFYERLCTRIPLLLIEATENNKQDKLPGIRKHTIDLEEKFSISPKSKHLVLLSDVITNRDSILELENQRIKIRNELLNVNDDSRKIIIEEKLESLNENINVLNNLLKLNPIKDVDLIVFKKRRKDLLQRINNLTNDELKEFNALTLKIKMYKSRNVLFKITHFRMHLESVVYYTNYHYICVFRRYDSWYVYDKNKIYPLGNNENYINELHKKYSDVIKSGSLVPMILFYRSYC